MNSQTTNREIEVRFLEIDVRAMTEKLRSLQAQDLGEDLFRETIIYDKDLAWPYDEKKFVRVRENRDGVFVTFKQSQALTASGTVEVEFKANSAERVKTFMEHIGLVVFREQEKKRHTWKLGEVVVDIDTWPRVPTYVELEGPDEASLRDAAAKLGLDWSKAEFRLAGHLIEQVYGIKVHQLHYFTFDRVE